MIPPKGYCDLRVEKINKDIINAYVALGYNMIAVNTTLDSFSLDSGVSNRKKRKKLENTDNDSTQQDCIPPIKPIENDSNLVILNRLTIKLANPGQFQKLSSSKNFKSYDIMAVEPLNEQVCQEIITSQLVDIIVCNVKNGVISAKGYKVAVDKNIHFELCYGPMVNGYFMRQDTITLAHMLHMKGKSKNIIVSSGANVKTDIRNPHDIINLGLLLGLSNKQSKDSVTENCHLVILKSYGRKLGKSAINVIPINDREQKTVQASKVKL
ncbi:ribonuclease P protein subunit p30 [Adelges cooleyi]|uniref:ribonuclease P protein subunit p30 n=1 Tax=Adelges cooleyi TaxID=133065 RepID=UPI00217FE82E|nr:ribonuclease P protein subunit p30 [Adelges cooleyi]XP_050426143.1 ribonuclease P protein subunit p30 [Adelges cooleyi]